MNKICTKICTFTAILSVVAFAFACAPREGETTPEMAKNILKLRGYNFTEADYFKAISVGDLIALKTFHNARINPNAKNEKGETALTYAVHNADNDKVFKLVLENADVNMRDSLGNSPIFLAVKDDKKDFLNLLLEKNADVNLPGKTGEVDNQTALFAAVTNDDKEIIKKLLDRGADPNIADSKGLLPLPNAVIGSNIDVEIVKMLLDKGANVNAQEKENGATALVYIASNKQVSAQTRGEIVKSLLDKGADKSIKTTEGKTAFDWAKELKNEDVVELLK